MDYSTMDEFQRANYLDNSYALKKRLMSSPDSYGFNPIRTMVEDLYGGLPLSKPNYTRAKKMAAMENILTNLLLAADKGKTIMISRDSKTYSHSKYAHFSYNNMINMLDTLIEEGLIEQAKGYYDSGTGEGRVTRIWATTELLQEYSIYKNAQILNCFRIEEDEQDTMSKAEKLFEKLSATELVVLKDADKKHLPYKALPKVKAMIEFLVKYNELMDQSQVQAPITDILNIDRTPPSEPFYPGIGNTSGITAMAITHKILLAKAVSDLDCRLYRVFNNGSFEQGGRFYGADYQQLNEKARSNILINGNPVTEVDYCGLHINMLYNMQGLPAVEDPYAVFDGSPLRKLFKKALLITLNADSRRGAVAAFNIGLKHDSKTRSLLKAHNMSTMKIYELIDAYFSSIRHYFYSGIGLTLMNKDSIIADNVLRHFTQKGIPCLCVHDSFIVEEQYSDELKKVMSDAYYNQFKFIPYLK